MRQRFVTSEKVDHFHLVRFVAMHGFERREELIHGYVDRNYLDLFPARGTPPHLVRNLRARDEDISTSELVIDPRATDITLSPRCLAGNNARDQRLRSRRHEKAIDHARVAMTPHVNARPA